MRPVQLPATAPASYPEAALKAKGILVKEVGTFTPATFYPQVGTTEQNQQALIDQWLENQLEWLFSVPTSLRKLAAPGAENERENGAFDSYQKALGDVKSYGSARAALIAEIGAYCSYCEVPLTSNLAVEHVLPKKWFPALQLAWTNFLLCCPICNSVKATHPTQEIDGVCHSSDQAEEILAQRYAWPQRYWRGLLPATLPVLPFTYTLVKYDRHGNTWTPRVAVHPADLGMLVDRFESNASLITHGALAFATASSADPEHAVLEYYQLRVAALPGNAAAARMIDLVDLNRRQPPLDQDTSDLRAAYRTQAYFRALSLLRRLNTAAQQKSPLLATLVPAVLKCMTLTGFWSVWSFVFGAAANPAAHPARPFQPDVNRSFPGTPSDNWVVG